MGQRKLLIAALVLAGLSTPVLAECGEKTVELKNAAGTISRFSVEIADSSAEQAQGLMARTSLASSKGMLFVYPDEREVAFWMSNTLIPLDMLFIDDTGRVAKIKENAEPGNLTLIPSDEPVQFVLEINGGLARALGIEPGAMMRHPLVDQTLAGWACSAP